MMVIVFVGKDSAKRRATLSALSLAMVMRRFFPAGGASGGGGGGGNRTGMESGQEDGIGVDGSVVRP